MNATQRMGLIGLDALEEYFRANVKVAIHNVPVTLEDAQTRSFKDMLAHDKAPAGNSMAMTIFEKISSVLEPIKGKIILDVGCNTGYFSFLMAESGATVVAVEKNPISAGVAEYLNVLKNLHVKIINSSVEDFILSDSGFYDATLLLNVFDHMLRENEERAWEVLKQIQLRSKYVFMMVGPTEQLPNVPGVRTSCPLNIPFGPVKESSELGCDMVLRKGLFKEYHVLLQHSYADRELWVYEK